MSASCEGGPGADEKRCHPLMGGNEYSRVTARAMPTAGILFSEGTKAEKVGMRVERAHGD